MFTGAKYARSGDVNIAYQVVGSGSIDLVLVLGWVSHLAYVWELPALARFLNRLASFSRLILFDKRGCGMSDRVHPLPTLEQRMDDVRAVMDAVGSKRAAVLGVSEGGPMGILFATTHPDRVSSLILYGTYARRVRDEQGLGCRHRQGGVVAADGAGGVLRRGRRHATSCVRPASGRAPAFGHGRNETALQRGDQCRRRGEPVRRVLFQQHHHSTGEVLRMNSLEKHDSIRPGDRLRIAGTAR